MNINRTIIIPAMLTPLARALAEAQSAGGAGMFTTPLYTGAEITHYISSGWIDEAYDAMLPLHEVQVTEAGIVVIPPAQAVKDASANLLFESEKGLVTIEQCKALVETSIVIDCDVEGAQTTIARMGLGL